MRKIFSIVVLPIGLIKYIIKSISVRLNNKEKKGLCVVAIVKDEDRYIEEFVEYYRNLNADLLICDNDSENPIQLILGNRGGVKTVRWTGIKRQIDAYNNAINLYGKKYKYMLFVDIDEFIVSDMLLDDDIDLETVMDNYFKRYKDAASLAINWKMFGSSWHKNCPIGGVLENYIYCARDDFERNMMIKVCVRPEMIIGFRDPHFPLETFGYFTVNTDGVKVNSPRNVLPVDKSVFIHHYFLKSYEDFEKKVKKGFADRVDSYHMDIFEYYDRNECYNDKTWLMNEEIYEEELDDEGKKYTF